MSENTVQTTPQFHIKTEVFEGPLDLLLSLIEKRKLFINDISLSKVTDEYITYIGALPAYSLGDRTSFIQIASTLLLIKAKSLLPSLDLTSEESENINDLERRLKELELMRKAGAHVREIFGQKVIHSRGDIPAVSVFAPSKDLSFDALVAGIQSVITSLPKPVAKNPEVRVKKTMSIDEMMNHLTERITKAMRMSFKDISRKEKAEKVHVIVSFLAMLELVKQGTIKAEQEGLFDEIIIESHNVGIPRY